MKKWKKISAATALLGLGVVSMGITPIVLVSCSSGESNTMASALIKLNNQYLSNESTFLADNAAGLPKFEGKTPDFSQIINNANEAIKALNNFKTTNQSNLGIDEIIWLDSYIFQWENKIRNIESGLIYLGANPIKDAKVLSTSSNHIRDIVKEAVNIYPLNPETGDPDSSQTPDVQLLKNMVSALDGAIGAIKDYQKYMDYGMTTYGIQPSTVVKKIYLYQMVSFFYGSQLEEFAQDNTQTSINMEGLVKLSLSKNYFTMINDEVKNAPGINEQEAKDIADKLVVLKTTLDDFMVWYATTYYANSDSFGPQNSQEVTLTKTDNSADAEQEKTLTVDLGKNTVEIYGLGLTKANLNQKNVGIGFMNLKNGGPNANYNDGNKIYQQMLFNNNSINNEATEIYQKGLEYSSQAKTNMTSVANQVKGIITNGFNNKIWFDEDGIGKLDPQEISLASEPDDFAKFNKWLNQEDFFFGREHLADQDLTNYIDKYWNNPSGDLKKYQKTIQAQGYEKHELIKKPLMEKKQEQLPVIKL